MVAGWLDFATVRSAAVGVVVIVGDRVAVDVFVGIGVVVPVTVAVLTAVLVRVVVAVLVNVGTVPVIVAVRVGVNEVPSRKLPGKPQPRLVTPSAPPDAFSGITTAQIRPPLPVITAVSGAFAGTTATPSVPRV
jgi:hypothetical protein